MRPYAFTGALAAIAAISVACGTAAPPTTQPSPAASRPPSPASTPTPSDAATPAPTALATSDPNADPNEAILAVETRGGRCVGGPCGNIVIVNRDGRVHVTAKPPNELGFVSPENMAALDQAIRSTDFAELFSHPFRGDCPTAYDGQELVVEVLTPTGVQRIESCAVEVDYGSPLFTAISEAVGEFVPLLNQ